MRWATFPARGSYSLRKDDGRGGAYEHRFGKRTAQCQSVARSLLPESFARLQKGLPPPARRSLPRREQVAGRLIPAPMADQAQTLRPPRTAPRRSIGPRLTFHQNPEQSETFVHAASHPSARCAVASLSPHEGLRSRSATARQTAGHRVCAALPNRSFPAKHCSRPGPRREATLCDPWRLRSSQARADRLARRHLRVSVQAQDLQFGCTRTIGGGPRTQLGGIAVAPCTRS